MRRHDSRVSLFARQARLASGWTPEPCWPPSVLRHILRGALRREQRRLLADAAFLLFMVLVLALAFFAPAL